MNVFYLGAWAAENPPPATQWLLPTSVDLYGSLSNTVAPEDFNVLPGDVTLPPDQIQTGPYLWNVQPLFQGSNWYVLEGF